MSRPTTGGDGPVAAARSLLSRALLLALIGTLAVVAAPGAAPEARAEDDFCRNPVTGDDQAEPSGPHPLIGLLGLRHTWDLSTGAGVDVAVIDSGVDHRHPDLDEGSIHDGSNFTVVREEREYDRSTPAPPLDCSGHGTAIAGLIAADRTEGDRVAGVAPHARIHPVRVHNGIDEATFNMIAAMIDDAVAADVDVINLSVAVVEDHDVIREAVENALDQDIVVVAAGGNEGDQGAGGGRMYPAAYPGVLAVAAVDREGTPLDSSNTGDWIDIAAYGDALTVLAPGGSGYRQEGGTSFAAAQVSGTAALVRSRFPDLSAQEVRARVLASAAPVEGARSVATGAGIVDPFGALTHAAGGAGDDGEHPDEAVAIHPIPHEPPAIHPTAVTSLVWSGALLLAMVLGLFAVPAVRRAMRRGWRAGPLPQPAVPPTAEPSTGMLRRLDGSDVPPPARDQGRGARGPIVAASPSDPKRS